MAACGGRLKVVASLHFSRKENKCDRKKNQIKAALITGL